MAERSARRGLFAGASFFGVGKGYGRAVAGDPATPPADPANPPADTKGDDPPAPPGTPRQQLRGKMQQVIDDDAADDPNEMQGDGAEAQARGREQARCAAIMGSAHAQGREDYAAHLAFNTRHTRQDAIGLLGAAPKATKGGLGAAMEQHQHQRPGPDAAPPPADARAALDKSWDAAAQNVNGGATARRH